jgi:hypothetical protein
MACMAVGFGIFVTGEPVALLLVLLASLLIGVGMGMANLATLVSAQSAVPIRRIGATSTLMLFRTFGGAFCISLIGTVHSTICSKGSRESAAACPQRCVTRSPIRRTCWSPLLGIDPSGDLTEAY